MLHNLGYKKVTAIFDGDKEEEYKKCCERFKDYNIKILFKDDIRDKEELHKLKKDGVTTKSGKIKEENKEDFIKLLNEINAYHISKNKENLKQAVKLLKNSKLCSQSAL